MFNLCLKCIAGMILAISLALAWGCEPNSEQPGVVARVNGRPILLAQLEFKHDLIHADETESSVPTVENLRKEFGQILADLIVQELVLQALEAKGMDVTDEEVKIAEDTVRLDYPEGAFEQVLIEEYVDLGAWREQLRYHMALDKFFQQMLRPNISLTYKEAEQYYKDHLQDFYVPARFKLLLISGPSREVVKKAAELYGANGDIKALSAKFNNVRARVVTIREQRLPAPWMDALRGLLPGQATSALTGGGGFEVIILLEKSPARLLDPSEAYPLVEKVLLEKKLQKAFDQWLHQSLETADIKVSRRILDEAGKPEETEEAPEGGGGNS